MTTVAAEDPSRPPWPSCPAHGWSSGVDALWGLPNNSPLGLQPNAKPPAVLAAGPATCAQQPTDDARESLGCTAGDSCSYVANVDYDQGTMGKHVQTATAAACCHACAQDSGCWAATWTGSDCWFKNKTQTLYPIYDGTTTGCWPAGRVPPPPPPPQPLACATLSYETHGYYQHGEGFKTVNSGSGNLEPFSLNVPPQMAAPSLTGPACPGTCVRGGGCRARMCCGESHRMPHPVRALMTLSHSVPPQLLQLCVRVWRVCDLELGKYEPDARLWRLGPSRSTHV